MTAPTDWSAFLQILVNPITFGMLLTWFLGHIPLIKNDDVTNWVKFVFAVVVCFVWAFVVILGTVGLPSTPSEWYTVAKMGLAVLFVNQAFYQAVNRIPGLGDFLMIFFGKGDSSAVAAIVTPSNFPGTTSTVLLSSSGSMSSASTGVSTGSSSTSNSVPATPTSAG